MNDVEEYEIEQVLDSKLVRNSLKYLVKWRDYDAPAWEPAQTINEAAAIGEFHQAYPAKPGPLPED